MRKQILFLFIFFALLSCRDRNNNQNIPEVFVDISLSLDLPAYNALSVPSSWIPITGGSNGIIIYSISQDEFVAFDRHCTYDVNAFHRVMVENEASTVAVDIEGCGSRFSIFSGDVLQNPAVVPLKQYNTEYFPGSNVLRIYN